MTIAEHDAKCNGLWRKLDALKASGMDRVKGSEYDAVLRELQSATRERLSSVGLITPTIVPIGTRIR
jgi:hypothetical protein